MPELPADAEAVGPRNMGQLPSCDICSAKVRDFLDTKILIYILLPCRQVRELRRAMREKGSFWIVKPPNMWCGLGIKVISDNKDVPAASGLMCVQRYIKEPLLINNLKFDLRLYLLITSVEPLRMYLCEEGLTRQVLSIQKVGRLPLVTTRFATDEYTNDPSQLNNNFIHLTNFSLNKESDKFIPNSNPEEAEVDKCMFYRPGEARDFYKQFFH